MQFRFFLLLFTLNIYGQCFDILKRIDSSLLMSDQLYIKRSALLRIIPHTPRADSFEELIPISDFFPLPVKNLPPVINIDGPNCHNATMIWHGLITELREVKSHELISILKKKFRKVKTPHFGDLIVLRFGEKDAILHSAIHLGDGYIWHKPGYLKNELWETNSFEKMYQEYSSYTIIEFYRRR